MDPIELALIRGRLQQATDEMDLVHVKAAFSPIVSETWDRANAIIDAGTGEVIVQLQGTTSLPIFIYTMQASAQACIDLFREELRNGDVIIVNDPYLGGTHLQDVKLIRPFFHDGNLELLFVNTTHIVDVGGALPSGFDPDATDIFQEGLQIPPTWLVREGQTRDDVMRLILGNTRLAESQEGDLRAQMNALDVGVRRVQSIVDEYGMQKLRDCIDELATRSDAQMRSYLADIPRGSYEFEDYVEADNESDPLIIRLRISIDDGVHLDFSGSSPYNRGPMNLAAVTTKTAALCAFKHLYPEVPINGGCFRPFTFTIPEGCFLNARRPQAVGGYPEASIRVLESVFGALSHVLPEGGYAGSGGTAGSLNISGTDITGKFFGSIFPTCGGYGASRGSDGLVHAPTTIGLARFPSLEASEHDFPVLWEAMELRPDSGGAGKWRGGMGTRFRVRVLTEATASYLGDRARHRPFGAAGGKEGALLEVKFTTSDGVFGGRGASKLRGVQLKPGDTLEVDMPGGGGYGPPEKRDLKLISRDLDKGYITIEGLSKDWNIADPRTNR